MSLDHVLDTCGLHVLGDLTTSTLLSCLPDESIAHISSSQDHTVLVCESGRAYILRSGALEAEPFPLPEGVHALRSACGLGFTLLLCDGGDLYAHGNNVYGQLGLGDDSRHEPVHTPERVRGLPPVSRVAAGAFHAVALTPAGEVWSCGLNVDGQLGLGHDDAQTTFARVHSVSHPVVEVACGHSHTAILSASRVLLVAGCNHAGQLGLGATSRKNVFSYSPVYLPAVVDVACGLNHTAAVTEDGSAWTWGANAVGQLGNGSDVKGSSPSIVPGLEGRHVTRVFARCDRTAVVSRGHVFLCGKGIPQHVKDDQHFVTLAMKSTNLAVKYITFSASLTHILVAELQETSEPSQKSFIDTCDSENVPLQLIDN